MTNCPDGIKANVEACDDGNLNDTDGCSNLCAIQADSNCVVIGVQSFCDVCGNTI